MKPRINFTFLLCSERSGSNFITKLMNNHSQICGPSTKHIINPLARNYFRYQPLTKDENWEALLNDVLSLFNVSFSVWKSTFDLNELKENTIPGDIGALIAYFFNKEADINNKENVFIKEIKLYEFYPFLKRYFPKCNYVYQVRDPRDMALSWKKNTTHHGGIIAAAKQWKNDQQQYLKIKSLEEMDGNITFLRYEDLISNTENELKKVLKMCDLAFEPSMVDMGKDELTNKNAGQQKAWENLAKPIMKSNFNKYRKELTEQEIKMIEAICFFEMKYLGYEPENEWESLNSISNNEINKFNQEELNSLEYKREDGVKANMEAKKVFYQKNMINVS